MILHVYADIQRNTATPRRDVLAHIFKEARLRSSCTQLTKVQITISVQGRHTEASYYTVYIVNEKMPILNW